MTKWSSFFLGRGKWKGGQLGRVGVCYGVGALQRRGEGIVGWLRRRVMREILSGEEGL